MLRIFEKSHDTCAAVPGSIPPHGTDPPPSEKLLQEA